WIWFAVWTIAILLFSVWYGNPWILLLIVLFFDAYITKYIPWTFWKKSKNKSFRKVMEWVDAIIFALIAVYFINVFFFQNYQIPTSSLEKSLLVGDFLAVSKLSYGPRAPMTPLSFPLAQHTMPVVGGKSYLDKPQWKYR
ncbi:MAG TPA: S26 family signal peptidase, partial [Porphyromonadaceae bacterium]|nr:S26 family signal peptidase [Porphyromonadaceae bacterium]